MIKDFFMYKEEFGNDGMHIYRNAADVSVL